MANISESKNRIFFTGIKHSVQYDTWQQFLLNEEGLKRLWNDFSLFSWNRHPTKKYLFQLSWISKDEFRGDLPHCSPIKKLNSYLEIRTIEIKFTEHDESSIQEWLTNNTPSFWPNPSLFSSC
jgi:hypothetical protein